MYYILTCIFSSLNELEEREKAVRSKEQKLKQYQQTVKDLQQELGTKNDLVLCALSCKNLYTIILYCITVLNEHIEYD